MAEKPEMPSWVPFISVPGTFLEAFVAMKGWEWFVVPLGVPAIGYWHAMGLTLLFYLVRRRFTAEGEMAQKVLSSSTGYLVGHELVAPLLALLWLWLLHFGVG